MDIVSDTFGALAEALLASVGNATTREEVYTAYSNTQKFDSDSDLVLEAGRESYVDLYDLAVNLAAEVTDPGVVSAANALVAAWDVGLVLTEAHGSGTAWRSGAYWDLEDAHGLSVYLPLGEELTMVITHTNEVTAVVPIRSLYGPDEAPNTAWRESINAYVAVGWPGRGGEMLPARPVAYLDGPRPGLLSIKKTIYLPLAMKN